MKIIKNNNPSSNLDDSAYEVRVLRFLGENAFILPETEKEMDNFIHLCESTKLELPPALKDPFEILRRGLVQPRDTMGADNADAAEIEINLAQAAREGKEIPEHILKRMEENRKNAEGKK